MPSVIVSYITHFSNLTADILIYVLILDSGRVRYCTRGFDSPSGVAYSVHNTNRKDVIETRFLSLE